MKLSKRVIEAPESPIRKLEAIVRQAKGIKVLHLNIGQPDIESPRVMIDWLKKADIHHLSYAESQGSRLLIKEIVKYYHKLGAADINEDNVIVTLGGSEGILWSFMALADCGDEVLVFEPFYTNVEGYAKMADVRLVPVTCNIEDGFHLPKTKIIKSKITSKTRAIYLCNPNNPTGTFYTTEEVKSLYRFCLENNLYLIMDEVYRDFVYSRNKLSTALTLENGRQTGRMVIIDSFSKRYSLCGIRVGSIITRNQELIRNVLKFGQARLSAGDLDQQIASKMNLVPSSYFNQVKQEYAKRREIVYQGLKKIPGAVFSKPEGAFYFIVQLPVGDADKFCRWLLTDFNDNKETVMLAPANGFYLSKNLGREEVRIAYVINQKDLSRAMELLNLAVAKYYAYN